MFLKLLKKRALRHRFWHCRMWVLAERRNRLQKVSAEVMLREIIRKAKQFEKWEWKMRWETKGTYIRSLIYRKKRSSLFSPLFSIIFHRNLHSLKAQWNGERESINITEILHFNKDSYKIQIKCARSNSFFFLISNIVFEGLFD